MNRHRTVHTSLLILRPSNAHYFGPFHGAEPWITPSIEMESHQTFYLRNILLVLVHVQGGARTRDQSEATWAHLVFFPGLAGLYRSRLGLAVLISR